MELFIFHHLTGDPVVQDLLRFQEDGDTAAYYRAARALIGYAEHRLTEGNLIKEYILRTMLERDTLADLLHLRDFLRQDVKTIYHELLAVDWDARFRAQGLLPLGDIGTEKRCGGLASYVRSLESMMDSASNEALGGAILAHAESFGTGKVAAYPALCWKGEDFAGVSGFDETQFADLSGMEEAASALVANTESFMQGRPANDALLVGPCGSGKTSCAAACLHLFKDQGLRVILLKTGQIAELSAMFTKLRNRTLKYIFLLDAPSLTAEEGRWLAAALDARTEAEKANILFYATVSGEEAACESNLPISHFGLRVDFSAPDGDCYLSIVEKILAEKGVLMTEEIKAKALAWQGSKGELSGRMAKQFAVSILSRL